MRFTNQTGARAFAKDPAVVRFAGTYWLYHSTWIEDRLGVGIATSDDLEHWKIVGDVPPTQPCEAKGIGAPAAIALGDTLHLFYQTYGGMQDDAICHATSTDGLHFVKDETNPIFRPTNDWCCGRAIDADVVPFGGKLFLYFATRDHDFRIQMLGVATADMSSAFSRADWTQAASHAILAPELPWEQACIEAAATLVHDGRIYLFYGGAYNCMPQQIGCAVSEDGVHFRRVSDAPLLGPGPAGSWNASESGHPYAFQDDDGTDHLFYQGSPDGGDTWILAHARIHWDGDMPRLVPTE